MEKKYSNFVGCTIAAQNYLAQANVLARSFQRYHPSGRFVILIVDQYGGKSVRADGVELFSLGDIGLAQGDMHHMPIIYDVTEFSTAVKPWLLESLLGQNTEVVMYFDPDIEIFAPLNDVADLAHRHSIVLTPHVTEAIPRDGRQLSESDILASGIYNLGFIAIGRGAKEFLAWWKVRLRRECMIDQARMRFTDQRWIDFVPGLFPHFILRDPTCNVAYWNLYSRQLVWSTDHYEVNGKPLRFFHFSGYDPDQPHLLSKHQGAKPRILFSEHPGVAKICESYRQQLLADNFVERKRRGYGFDLLPDGLKIDRHIRRAYREALVEFENGRSQAAPASPFAAGGQEGFISWLNEPMKASPVVTRYMLAIHSARTDLREDFPEPLRAHAAAFHAWFVGQGRFEEKVPDVLVPSGPATRRTERSRLSNQGTSVEVIATPVTVVGYFRAELGIGEAARLLLAGIEAAGIPYQTLNYDDTISRQDHPFADRGGLNPHSDINILCINADQTPNFAAKMGSEFFERRYTIGLWFWEVEKFPSSLQQAFNHVNEIWVASDFMRDALLKASPHPVTKIPLPVVGPRLDLSPGVSEPGSVGKFTFFFNFDFMSVFERKNPLGLIEAFSRAFAPGEGPMLLIKTINGDKRLSDLERLRLAAAGRSDITVLDGYVSAAEKDRMMSACDCYVSLHRSEGYGLTLAEALSLGKPVMATGYSGNLEFMTAKNSYLCSYELRSVGAGNEPYPPSAHWAEPNIQEAAALLREVYQNPENARRKGEDASTGVLKRFSPAATGEVIRQRLERIRSSRVSKAGEMAKNETLSLDAQLDELEVVLDEASGRDRNGQEFRDALTVTKGGAHSLLSAKDKLASIRALHRFIQTGANRERNRLEQVERELWEYRVKRADASARARQTEERLKRIEKSAFWRVIKPLRKLFMPSSAVNRAIASDLIFKIDLPQDWRIDNPKLLVEGWCFSRTGKELAGVRAKVRRQGRLARYGIERLDVWRGQGLLPQARFCGFSIELSVPIGTSLLSLEAIKQGEGWEPFFETEIACSPSGGAGKVQPPEICTALESNQQPGD